MTTGTAPVGGTTSRRRHRVEPVVSDPWGRPDPWVAPTVDGDLSSGDSVAEVDGGAPPPPPGPAVEQQAWSVPVQEWTAPVDEPADPAPAQSWAAPVQDPAEPAPAWSPEPADPPAPVPSAAADALFAPLAPREAEPSRRSSPTSPLRPPTAPAWAEAWVVA